MALAPRDTRVEFLVRVILAWWRGGQPPVQVSSYVRTPESNRRAGGAARSQHLIGTAIDLVGDWDRRFLEAARREGLVAVDEGDHVHLQLFRAGEQPAGLYPDV